MKVEKRRIRFKLESGQWTYWLNDDEVRRYRAEHIKEAVIEETMSYQDAMRYLGLVKA
jgi:hypothetical protein